MIVDLKNEDISDLWEISDEKDSEMRIQFDLPFSSKYTLFFPMIKTFL